jgi:hypothetical protein
VDEAFARRHDLPFDKDIHERVRRDIERLRDRGDGDAGGVIKSPCGGWAFPRTTRMGKIISESWADSSDDPIYNEPWQPFFGVSQTAKAISQAAMAFRSTEPSTSASDEASKALANEEAERQEE